MAKSKHSPSAAVPSPRRTPLSILVGAIQKRPVLTIVIVNVALGIAWLIRTQPHPFSDYYHYFKLAMGLLDEHQFGYPMPTARRLPGYPGTLAVLMLISRSFFWLGLCNVLLNAALLPVIHRLTLSLSSGNARVALLATLLCALNPTFVYFSPIIASEHLFVLLMFSSLLAPHSTRFSPNVRTVVSGALLGCAVLTRGEGVFYAPVVPFAAWTVLQGTRRRKLARAAMVLGVAALVTLPWAARNLIVIGSGAGLSTVSGVNFYYGHNSTQYGYHSLRDSGINYPRETDRQKYWFRRGAACIEMNPSRLWSDIANGTDRLWVRPGTYAVRAALVVKSAASPTK